MTGFNLERLVRPNIWALEPYRCARDDFKEGILLDANENAYGPSIENLSILSSSFSEAGYDVDISELNRYPDPHQISLKTKLCQFRNYEGSLPNSSLKLEKAEYNSLKLTASNLCLGVGSDESIDALIRTICQPTVNKLLICPPTYGMYHICAQVNDVEIVKVPLDFTTFQIQPERIIEVISKDPSINMIYITSPGNPTAALVDFDLVKVLLEYDGWNGLVVLDEAYVDFSKVGSSSSILVNKYPNLVVLQTLSKSFGLAAIRLGITFASKELAGILNALKAPYNISTLTSTIANKALSPESIKLMRSNAEILEKQKYRVLGELKKIKGIGKNLGGLDSNFILVQVIDKDGNPNSDLAKQIYEKLAIENGVVIRYRGNEPGCPGALRITIGTEDENTSLLEKLKKVFSELL
ncbi:histidinol-phosphate transaminase [Ascoidea rubescens DSM 1968]|uniref:histidinol-phosphate transaminase n=1 Tax=Ascoidea rubescens DSM 1968 TaxID=1344418 RepID=A0A1D2VL45_9ASCO|nr:histidinol-phosphate aminotransferase [Ascoidea rubescens DSM 1968]ODV62336.1 histidinol-phosphate aminotransferase [Ascoidea rubescens DSM 1968]